MSKKYVVYITGCLGFIGSYVTQQCLDQGWYVRGIDKCTYAARLDMLPIFQKYDNFSFNEVDINDLTFLYDCDYVINTAAETHVGNSIVKSDEFIESNINGVHRLLELIRLGREDHKPTFLHFSTDEVYGDIDKGSHKETDLLKPSNPYSATKAAADMLVLAWARTYNIPYVIVRPTNNYGIGQYTEKLIPKTCKYLGLDRKIPLHNNGTPIRNWLHAADTANAIITIIKNGVQNEIFNIAGHFEQDNLTTVCKILECYHGLACTDNVIKKHIAQAKRLGQDVRYAINDDKLWKLGWYPRKQFDEELPAIVDYYKEKFIW
jgi:dTDP-glucose 4,6-dehydratase